MNERIKILWDQAARENAKLFVGPNSWETEVNFMNTFAELIIKECVRIGSETAYDLFLQSKKEGDMFEYKSHGAEDAVDAIIEHFGVE